MRTWICMICVMVMATLFTQAQTLKKIVVDAADTTPPETKLHNVAYANNLLTVFYAGGNKLYADDITQRRMSAIFTDVMRRYKVRSNTFILSGFSAGGMIALRYVELCNEHPDRFPIRPQAVFTVDAPIDIFTIYTFLEDIARTRYAQLAHIKADHGVPRENLDVYSRLTAFSMDTTYGQNERYLVNTSSTAIKPSISATTKSPPNSSTVLFSWATRAPNSCNPSAPVTAPTACVTLTPGPSSTKLNVCNGSNVC